MRPAQAHRVQLHQHDPADDALGQLGVLAHRERDVLEHRHVGEQASRLEHHAHLAAQRVQGVGVELVNGPARDPDRSAVGLLLPADQAQQRRFSGAARAEDRDDFAAGNREAQAFQELSRAVGVFDAGDLDEVFSGGIHLRPDIILSGAGPPCPVLRRRRCSPPRGSLWASPQAPSPPGRVSARRSRRTGGRARPSRRGD